MIQRGLALFSFLLACLYLVMATSPNALERGKIAARTSLDVASYPDAPAELTLEQVHVYVRHGERTPVKVRMADPPASIPAHWQLCRTARQFRASVATFGEAVQDSPRTSDGVDFLPVKRIVERPDGTISEGECMLGELTDVGRQSTYSFGRSLRKLYVERLGFLPDTLTNMDDVYFRSTDMPRTIESLQQVMHGLYSRAYIAQGLTPLLRVRNRESENLIPNSVYCRRLEQLLVGFAQAAASAYNHTLEPLDEKISRYIGGQPIRIDGHPRASGILDTIRASKANSIAVPPEFEEKEVMDLIEKAVVTEWFADKTEEVRRLGMGRLLQDLSEKLSLKASPPKAKAQSAGHALATPEPRILVHSTHDTALAALLATLDVFDEKWPAFTASMTFELFRKGEAASAQQTSYVQSFLGALSPFRRSPSAPEYYIRMRYQNQNMPLPLCAEPGKHLHGHPEFCTLAAFQDRVKALVPKDWESACAPRPSQK